jgi:Ca2+-binding RTX toxin-like protein
VTELVDQVFSGEINPGQLVIVREILDDGDAFSFDTAQFSDALIGVGADGVLGTADDVQQYSFAVNGVATTLASLAANGIQDGDVLTVSHLIDDDGDGVPETPGLNGTDTLRHIERLQFADQAIVLRDGLNAEPVGQLVILDDQGAPIGAATPVEGEVLTVSIAGVTDADNVDADNATGAITGTVAYIWQFDPRGDGVFEDIVIATGLGDLRATGPTLTVPPDVAGSAIRVKALYEDAHGVLETVFSAPTAPVQGVNTPAAGAPTISDTTPIEGLALTVLTATIVDADGLLDAIAGGLFTFQWEQSADGQSWAPIAGATGQLFVPTSDQVGMMLRVVVTFTDDGGTQEIVLSTATQPVADDGVILLTEDADTFSANVGSNEIWALGGNDTIFALGGNDIVFGGLGDDFVDGGAGADEMWDSEGGDDTYVVDDPGDQVFEFGFDELQGIDTIQTTLDSYTLGPAGDTLSDTGFVENLTYIGTGSFTGIGNELDNVITGGALSDTLDGGLGSDTLIGGAGADLMIGGLGDDTYVVDDAGDQVTELAGEGTDTVQTLLSSYTLGSDLENLLLIGSGGFTGIGNGLDNVITGGAGNDALVGGAGSDDLLGGGGGDWLEGDAGNDALIGGAGNDELYGGAGEDWLDAGDGNDALIGDVGNDQLFGGAGDDWLDGGDGNDALIGDAGSDQIFGGAGDDWLVGGDGNDALIGDAGGDFLTGSAGDDWLVGGVGNDTFVFAPGFGNDVVADFDGDPATGGQDLFDISGLGITSATFDASVSIGVVGSDTLVTIGSDSIFVLGVNGVGANAITQQDFILA